MDQITNWVLNNWYEFGSLFTQFAFLIAVVWLGRKILTSLRAAQQQMGALLRLSMTDGLQESSKVSEAAGEIIASEPATIAQITSTPDPTPYVAAPLTLPEEEHNGGHLAGVVQWLQTPMPKKQKNGSPLKKVVRWLQAPARKLTQFIHILGS